MRAGCLRTITAISLLLVTMNQIYAQSPQRIVATFGDWTVTCVAPSNKGSALACELVQVQTKKGQAHNVKSQAHTAGQITISRSGKNQPFKIFFQVPPNVWNQAGIKFVSQPNQAPLVMQFKWCLPSRCLAEADLPKGTLDKFRTLTEPGREEYKDAAQHDVTLSVSFKGFGPALEWLLMNHFIFR